MYAQRLGPDRVATLNPFALLASQGVPLAFGSDSPVTGMNPWATVRAATRHQTPGSALSARAAFAAATRGAWRAAGVRDGVTGTLVPGAPASYAVWEADEFEVQRPGRRGGALVDRSRSRVPALPTTRRRVATLPPDGAPGCRHPWLTPRCRAARTVVDDEGRRRRHRRRADDAEPRRRVRAVRVRSGSAARLSTGCRSWASRSSPVWLLCLSFPPFGWWYLAFVAFALLAWVLTRETTTVAGGFGYGFLFGLVFYLPLLPWISGLVGAFPWIALSALRGAVPRPVRRVGGRRSGGCRDGHCGSRGCGRRQEWLKSTVPFGGFPWGVVAFSQTDGPLLSVVQVGGAPLLSFAVVLIGFSLAAITLEIVQWWRRGDDPHSAAPPAVVVPGACITVVLLLTALTWPQVRQSGVGRRRRPGDHGGRRAGQRAADSAWSSTPSVARYSTTTSAKRCGWPRTCAPAGRRSRCSSSGRRTPRTSIRWPIRTPRREISAAAAAIDAPILVGGVVAAPGYSPDNPVSTNSVIVWNPETGPGRSS